LAKQRDQAFQVGVAVVIAAIVFAGFARTFYLRRVFLGRPLRPLLLHGIVFTLWVLLLVVQTKRLMVCATIGILAPATARLPFGFILAAGPLAFFALADLVLVASVSYDVASRRRVHPAYAWGGLTILASQAVRLAILRWR
jgi:hypothetical protein